MHAFTCFILSFLGVALSLPLFRAEHKRDSIISLSPTVDPDLNLSNDNSCLGIGISVCDPITVNSTSTETATKSKAESDSATSSAPSSSSTADSGDSLINLAGGSGDSLINISPTISPDLSLSNDNSCLGIGISACDPITVGSTVTKTVTEESDDDTSSSSVTPSSTYPTSTASTSSATSATSTATSASSKGDSLIDLSPNASPDLNLSNDNGCLGIGISACDPITVDSIVNKTVTG
ncbi:hypothetical protein GGR53DRAFT_501921 [Hypoxylon sp. FL1150]|nr:hypothetical protein GGR53DRAFT_501921 [Hypoxylon sp. FL1150]